MEKKVYDYAIIGSGMGGLAIGALLASQGKTVCVIEGNDRIGGHSYTLDIGQYKFCHGVHYLMGCQTGGPMHKFLSALSLDSVVEFNELEATSYDLLAVGKTKIDIPHGMEAYKNELIALYPEHKDGLQRYFKLEDLVFQAEYGYRKWFSFWDVIKAPWHFLTALRYVNFTLHDMFEKFHFPVELRTILAGRIGNMAASPRETSFFMYAGMDVLYADSAYFPKKGVHFLVQKVAEKITKAEGSDVFLNTKVESINILNGRVVSLTTERGEFFAKEFISDIDPHVTVEMTGNNKMPRWYREHFNYEYSDSIFAIYLGLDIDLIKKGFKKQNIWHHSLTDLDEAYQWEMKKNDFSRPGLFISTSSLLTEPGTLCPPSHSTMEIITFANYDYFKDLNSKGEEQYKKRLSEITEEILDVMDANYLPGIRNYIRAQKVQTPLDFENILSIPKGNIYGRRFTPKNWGVSKIGYESPFKNLHFVGANATFPGIMGVTVGAMGLFDRLMIK